MGLPRLLLLLATLGACAAAADRPNVVYILCDDLGYGDVACLNPAGKIDPLLVLGGTVTLRGVRVGSRQLFEEMNDFIQKKDIHPVIGHRFTFDNARDAFAQQLKGSAFGKIVVVF